MLKLRGEDHPQLFDLVAYLDSRGGQAWLVGGTIRDLLLGLQPADYDIAFSGNLGSEILSWSKKQRGNWFWLDEERNQSRVLLDGGRLQFDFAPLRATTIEEDLRLRDFSLNAIALPFERLTAGVLIDPLNGMEDLKAGVLSCCSAEVLKNDPLRCLKGVRHHAQQGWNFTPDTLVHLGDAAPLLSQVAGERLRTELSLILAAPHLSSAIRILVETGLAQQLFPSFEHDKFHIEFPRVLKRLEELTAFDSIGQWLDEEFEFLLTLRSLLILTLLFTCTTDFQPTLVERLRLSGRSRKLIESLLNPVPIRIDFTEQDCPRIAALKVERLGHDPIARILYTLVRQQRAVPLSLCEEAIEHYVGQLRHGRVPDLMTGNALLRQNPTLRGKEIGDWLRRIKTAEIKGEISGISEVEPWLKRQFSD